MTTLTVINDLDNADNFCELYKNSLKVIHQYANFDIQQVLEKQEMCTLMNLHKMLGDQVQHVFLEYKDKRAINRQAKPKAISDIITMGISIVNESATRDLDSVFVARKYQDGSSQQDNSPLISLDTSEFSQLLITVINMRRELDSMQIKLNNLAEENTQPAAPLAAGSQPAAHLAALAQPAAPLAALPQPAAPLAALPQPAAPPGLSPLHLSRPCLSLLHLSRSCLSPLHISRPCLSLLHLSRPCLSPLHLSRPGLSQLVEAPPPPHPTHPIPPQTLKTTSLCRDGSVR
jgi:hypothetical protein